MAKDLCLTLSIPQVIAMNRFPTPKENIVLDLLFEWLRESRFNRTMQEYIAIAARVPKTEAVHA